MKALSTAVSFAILLTALALFLSFILWLLWYIQTYAARAVDAVGSASASAAPMYVAVDWFKNAAGTYCLLNASAPISAYLIQGAAGAPSYGGSASGYAVAIPCDAATLSAAYSVIYLISPSGQKAAVPIYEGPIKLAAWASPPALASPGAVSLYVLATNNSTGWWLGNITAQGCAPAYRAASIPPGGQYLARFSCQTAPSAVLTANAYNITGGAAGTAAVAIPAVASAAGIAPPQIPTPCLNSNKAWGYVGNGTSALPRSYAASGKRAASGNPPAPYVYPGSLFGAPAPIYMGYVSTKLPSLVFFWYNLSKLNININNYPKVSINFFLPFFINNYTIIFMMVTDKKINNIVIIYWYDAANGASADLSFSKFLSKFVSRFFSGSVNANYYYISAENVLPLQWVSYTSPNLSRYLGGNYGIVGFGFYFSSSSPAPLANGYFDYICVGKG